MELEIASLGAAKLDPDTSAPVVHSQIDQGDGEPSDYGETPLACALGLTALPAAADATGHAEGVLAKGLGGSTGMCVGARDVRCADVAKGLGPGGTALHSTGADASKRSQVRCLEDKIVIMVGNDAVIAVDRAAKQANVNLWGHAIEITETMIKIGVAGSGNAWLSLEGPNVTIGGQLVAAGGVSMGSAGTPLTLNTPLQAYLLALETYLSVIATAAASAPSGAPVGAATTAFGLATITPKATMGTLTTTGQ